MGGERAGSRQSISMKTMNNRLTYEDAIMSYGSKGSEASAEKALLLAVLEDAVRSCWRSNQSNSSERVQDWFVDKEAGGITSLNFICEHILKADPSRVRVAILLFASRHKERPGRSHEF